VGEKIEQVLSPTRVSRSDIRATLNNSKFVVIGGAGLTGEAAKRYFTQRGLETYFAVDSLTANSSCDEILTTSLRERVSRIQGKGFSLFSPGISPSGILAQTVFELGLPSISELDLLCELIGEPLVGVTGTNGKSTTTTLVHEMLSASRCDNELIGNIGVPFIEALNRPDQDKRAFVSEISSYQLEWAEKISPKVGIFLNLAPNHLERHLTMDEYFRSKVKLIETLQSDCYAVINSEDPLASKMAGATSGRVLGFGVNTGTSEYSKLSKDGLKLEINIKLGAYKFDLSPTPLLGFHNKMNLAASIPTALICGATVEGIEQVISKFAGLEHRLESVPNKASLRIINDSKATTATAAATDLRGLLDSTSDQPVTLLIGGLKKIGSWSILFDEVSKTNRVKQILFFGKDGREIMEELAGINTKRDYRGPLADTLKFVIDNSEKNEIILFAPGCPSFDAYSGFEERGRHFKSLVGELTA